MAQKTLNSWRERIKVKFPLKGILCFVLWFGLFESKAQFKELPASFTGIDFENTLLETESLNVFIQKFPYISFSGGGVAIADFDKDGWEDIFFVGNQVPSKMYANKGGLKFEQLGPGKGIKTKAWSNGVSIADVNNDGLLDIFITKLCYPDSSKGGNKLYINLGKFVFEEKSSAFGLDFIGNSIQASFFDYDADGFMDLYLINQPLESFSENTFDVYNQQNKQEYAHSDKLYHNEKGKRFKDVSVTAGILPENAFGLSVITGDFNQDNWTDIYVCNDYVHKDFLYINNRNGTFHEALSEYFDHTSLFTMGSAFSDLNNDGLSDLLTLDMNPLQESEYKISTFEVPLDKYQLLSKNHFRQEVRNMVQLNNGEGKFSEIGQLTGLAYSDWSWSVLTEDFNVDGRKDVFISNGLVHNVLDRDFMRYKVDSILRSGQLSSYKASPLENFKFVKLKPRRTPNQLHLQTDSFSFPLSQNFGIYQTWVTTSAAAADLDKDGDLDLVLSNADTFSLILENGLPEKYFLSLVFENPNRAYNAHIRLYQAGQMLYQEITNNQGILSSHFPAAFFGLPNNSPIDSLVIWDASQKKAVYHYPNQNSQLLVKEKDFKKHVYSKPKANSVYATKTTQGLDYFNTRSLINDLKKEPLLPHRLNVYGPYASVGDMDGNGWEDLVLSGDGVRPPTIFFQKPDGSFNEKPIVSESDSICVDAGVVIADFDSDNDLDIFVVSGGNELFQDTFYQDRLYVNDGSGQFSKCKDCLPFEVYSGSEAQALDFDRDGDQDIFVGSRNVPGRFPEIPASQLLQNKNGKFEDRTPPELARIGMVNSVLSKDFDQDGWTDLMVGGEWMPLLVFWNNHGAFEQPDTLLPEGFWQHLNWFENKINNTSFVVAGNWGLNSRFIPKNGHDIRMFSTDADDNGSLDPLICSWQDGTFKPIVPYEKITKELPFLRKKFLRYKHYKEASIKDCLGLKMDQAIQNTFRESKTHLLMYTGNRKFKVCEGPPELQFGPIMSSVSLGNTESGNPLLYLHGNFYENAPETGPIDANKGLIIELKPDGKIIKVEGIVPKISGNIRKLIPIQTKNGKIIMVLKSGEKAEIIGRVE